MSTPNVVQIKHPRTGLYTRINRAKGVITGHKKSPGPYKGVAIARRRQKGPNENTKIVVRLVGSKKKSYRPGQLDLDY